MKAIMISIKPKWVAKILNGEKTIEVRKSNPKCDLPIDVYIYCTKENNNVLDHEGKDYFTFNPNKHLIGKLIKDYQGLNGKVVAKFTLNKVEEILHRHCFVGDELKTFYFTDEIQAPSEFERLSCLTKEEIYSYCLYVGYAWHISNLVIFDKPKELSDFGKYGCKQYDNDVCAEYGERGHLYTNCFFHLTKAPQSWCYIEVEK